MRSGSLGKLVASYLATGGLWCFLINIGNALSGAPSAFMVVTGGASAQTKLLAVLRIVGEQVLLWPMQLYDRVLRTLIG
jgi:hypothetical protein